ncbi:TonB-dependent receptor [Sphingobium sp. EP60837]|uniref:TonB-dependent receptor n=1 Tax=Sphingobium sp. EP60837 TaxID=1855519 RepID=UPI0007DDBE01|nr:TonB-dependent receptor [Sphingobium sp. EP60837]ANI79229.1 Vibriobactin receptor [Sphingobium sp. EP60837]
MLRSVQNGVLLCTTAMTAIWIGGPAQAQLSPSSAADSAASSPANEIVVTAQRRNERAQDVPISITAFSPERLQQQGVTQAQDLQASVPSLVVGNNGNPSREAQSFTIRGQGATFQASPGVVVYLNEVPLPAPISVPQQGGPGNFVDLENVQVLNGPQGTLFGRNTTGGAVLLVPRKPTNDFGGYVQAKIGNYDNRELEGALNLPVIEDKVLLRVAGAYQDRDGYSHDVIWNTDRDNLHWYSGRVGLTLKPFEDFENYTMVYGAYSRTHGTGLVSTDINIAGLQSLTDGAGNPTPFCYEGPTIPGAIASCDVYRASVAEAAARGPRETAHGVDSFQKTKTWGITNTSTLNLTDELTARNIISYQRFRTNYSIDSDATVFQFDDGDPRNYPAPGQAVLPGDGTPITYLNATAARIPRDDLKVFTEELQLQGNLLDNRLTFTAGGFLYDQRPVGEQGAGTVGFCPAAFTGSDVTCSGYDIRYAIANRSKALYAQATLDLGLVTPALEKLKLTGGYRHTWDRITGSSNYYLAFPGGAFCLATNAIVADQSECGFEATLKTNAPTWNIGVDYRVSRALLLYGKISRGYKAGGVNANAVFDNTRTFTPEYVTSYEGGFKSDLRIADMPLRLNATYYYMNYRDIQRATGDFNPATGAGGAQILRANARIQGVEAEASLRPFPGLEVGGTFSYTDAKYKRYDYQPNIPVQDCTGNLVSPGGTAVLTCLPFQYVSPYIYSVHVSAERPLGGDLGTISMFFNYAHTASQHTEATVVPASMKPGEKLAAFGTLSLSLDWRNVGGSRVDIGLYGTNLTNKLYRVSNSNTYSSQYYNATLYGEPRMYGLRLRYALGG